MLSSAANGMRLPSLEVTLAYVTACGGDPKLWREKWRAVAESVGVAGPAGGHENAPGSPPPAQLPPDVPKLIGRGPEISLLTDICGAPAGGDASLVVVHGLVGSGKTALATHVAHRMRHRHPEGQLYSNLGGSTRRPRPPHTVLAGFIQAMGVAEKMIPDDREQRVALYRSLLMDRRMLILLDDAGNEAQVRPLLPPTARSPVVITARSRLPGLPATHRLALDVVAPRDSLAILGSLAGTERIEADQSTAVRIAEWCDHLPLALWVAGARLAARPDWTLQSLARRMRPAAVRLSWLRAGDVDVSSRVAAAYGWLSPPARRCFHRLSRARTRVVGRVRLPELSTMDNEDMIESLIDNGLLQLHSRGLFVPKLFRLFARQAPGLDG